MIPFDAVTPIFSHMYTHFSATWVRPTGVLTASGLEMTLITSPFLGQKKPRFLTSFEASTTVLDYPATHIDRCENVENLLGLQDFRVSRP